MSRSAEEVTRRLREIEHELRTRPVVHRSDRFVYTALGASDAVGVGGATLESGYVGIVAERLKQRLPTCEVHNLGISGATLADIARYELPQAVSLRPDLVTLMVGGNDVVQSVDPDDFRTALRYVLERLTAITRRIAVATVPNIALLPVLEAIPDAVLPFGDKRAYVSARSMALGCVLIEEASRRGLRLVHVTTSDVLVDSGLVATDGFHPSDAGYRRLADRFWEQIEPFLPL